MNKWTLFALFCLWLNSAQAQTNLYFPPLIGSQWQSTDPALLGYCPDRIDSLYQFLDAQNTKGFLLLKDGKIVLEKYFDTFSADSVWYWASAGKSLSAWLVGIAAEQDGVQIEAPVSTYLGTGWTSAPPDKEALIKVRHLLTMSSGLDDTYTVPGTDPGFCTDPLCMQYKADAGTRWAYHNGAYYLTQDVVEAASGSSLNQFTKTRLFDRIGARGLWFDHVMYSTPRSMARFGLLALADGIWAGDSILKNSDYKLAMRSTSQPMNKSYGYLWWLNGQQSFMLPQLQLVFPGTLTSNAPTDAYAALGKNDQKIYVVPSAQMVVVRMGEASNFVTPGGNTVPIQFDQAMWQYINALTCASSTDEPFTTTQVWASPNPAQTHWQIQFSNSAPSDWQLFDNMGRAVAQGRTNGQTLNLAASELPVGVYWFRCNGKVIKLLKVHE